MTQVVKEQCSLEGVDSSSVSGSEDLGDLWPRPRRALSTRIRGLAPSTPPAAVSDDIPFGQRPELHAQTNLPVKGLAKERFAPGQSSKA